MKNKIMIYIFALSLLYPITNVFAHSFTQYDSLPWMTQPSNALTGIPINNVGVRFSVIDWDQDGDLDALVAGNSGSLALWRGNGDGTFTVTSDFSGINGGAYSVYAPFAIDWDNDGDSDLLAGNSSGTISLYLNDGSDNLNSMGNLTTIAGTYAVPNATDWDNDGDLDTLVGSKEGTISLFINNGSGALLYDGTLMDPSNAPINRGSNTFLTPFVIDYDEDGDLDIITGERLGTLTYWQNNGSNRFTINTTLFAAIRSDFMSTPVLADINADGNIDVVIASNSNVMRVYSGDGTGNYNLYFNPDELIKGLDYSVPAVGDVDNDDDFDIVYGESNLSIRYYANDGVGDFANPQSFGGATSTVPMSPTIVDWDGDGDLDFLVSALKTTGGGSSSLTSQNLFMTLRTDYTLDLYLNDGAGNYTATKGLGNVSLATLTLPKISAADWDADGDQDVIVGYDTGNLALFRNNGDDTFTSSQFFGGIDVGFSAVPTITDWNHDGYMDLIVGAQDGTLRLYSNDGADNFSETLDFAGINVGGDSAPAVIDWDLDGDSDLVVGNYVGWFYLFLNTDGDEDGYATPTDCNDGNTAIHPGVDDICGDGIDQDCDGGDSTCPGETETGDSGEILNPTSPTNGSDQTDTSQTDQGTTAGGSSSAASGGGCSLRTIHTPPKSNYSILCGIALISGLILLRQRNCSG